MTMPTAAEAQRDFESAQEANRQAQQAARDAQQRASDAQQAATDAQSKAAEARADADAAAERARQAEEAATHTPADPNDTSAQDAATQAQADAVAADEAARQAESDAATKQAAATSAASAQTAADAAAAQTQAAEDAAWDRSQAATAAENAEGALANAQGDLQGIQVSPPDQAAYQQQLEDMRRDALEANRKAVQAQHDTHGYVWHTSGNISWKIDGCSWNFISGDQWKYSGTEIKAVVGHSTSIHLAPKHEANYGGKYTRIAGRELKMVAGAAITNIAGAKWDTIYGSKNERCLGAKLEHHLGTKTVIKNAPLKQKAPMFFEKHATKHATAVDVNWKAGNQDIKSDSKEIKVLQEQTEMGKHKATLKTLIGEYTTLKEEFSGKISLELKEGAIRAADISIKGSSKVTVTSKGNDLQLKGGGAKLFRSGNVAECKTGLVKLNGAEFKAE